MVNKVITKIILGLVSVFYISSCSTSEQKPLPKANFTSSATKIFINNEVSFKDISENEPTEWLWDFGDGTTSEIQNPSHNYIKSGIYTVSLFVANETGQAETKKQYYIKVYDVLVDIDDNSYKTININGTTWMAENLRTTRLNNGTIINELKEKEDWSKSWEMAFCWYENYENLYKKTYGALYNYEVIKTRNICPEGWRIPHYSEWNTLFDLAGSGAHTKLAEGKMGYWISPDNGTDILGFSARGGGFRAESGEFYDFKMVGKWWSMIPVFEIDIATYGINTMTLQANRRGMSIRCVKE